MSDPGSNICQLCMMGSSFGVEKAQYVLLNGAWHPWPLVAAKPDNAPCIRLPCHIHDPDGYVREAAQINQEIERAKVRDAS